MNTMEQALLIDCVSSILSDSPRMTSQKMRIVRGRMSASINACTLDLQDSRVCARSVDRICRYGVRYGLQHIRRLDLSRNGLTGLPDSICELGDMAEVDLHSNRLASLPAAIGRLKNLTILDVTDNLLKSLPHSIGELTSLKELWAQKNLLDMLPQSACWLTALILLDPQRHNRLLSVSDCAGSWRITGSE